MNNTLPMVVMFRNSEDGISSNDSSRSLNLVTEISEMDDSPSFMEKDAGIREFGLDSLVERMALPEYFKNGKNPENEFYGQKSGTKLSNSDYAYFDSNANQYRFLFAEEPVRADPIEYSNPPAAEIVVTNSDYAYLDAEKNVKPEYKLVSGANDDVIASPSDPWMLRPFLGHAHQYQKYTPFGLGGMASLSYAGSDTNTNCINDRIPAVFNKNYNGEYNEMEAPIAPHNETLNKRHLNCESRAELADLDVVFEEKKKVSAGEKKVFGSRSNETMNKGLIGQDSLYDMHGLPAIKSMSEYGLQVIRDWGIQSLEDLRALPNNFETEKESNRGVEIAE